VNRPVCDHVREDTGSWAKGELQADLQADAREARSLDALYRDQGPRLLRSLTRWTRSRGEAEDLLQEVFARLAGSGAARIAGIERPEAYLGKIARNLWKDQRKASARRSRHLHLISEDPDDAAFDQVRHLQSRDTLRRLEEAVSRLKPKTRDIFLAHRLEGLNYAQIAERTGLSVKGVEKQMSKAIAQIDRLMDRL
jgi:RNA polymerase sigma-70 factor (ECF subfamily)